MTAWTASRVQSLTGGVAGRGVEVSRIGGLWRVTRPVHPGLCTLLGAYNGFWEEVATRLRVRLVPVSHVSVIITLGEPYSDFRRLGASVPGSGPIGSVVGGLSDAPYGCEHPGGKEAIRPDLTPLGAYRLLAMPMGELTNQVVELRDVLGAGSELLVERLAATRDWAASFDLLDDVLLARLGPGPEPAPEVAHAWRLLADTSGAAAVARIAAETGWSQGHLIRQFTRQVGLTPKRAARVLRFERALQMLGHGTAGQAEIAAACGYFDQAHLSREFRALAGTTPGLMMAARTAEGEFAL